MSERPIERLNYFNGQRLEADDLRLEQEYHIRIQRWLSRSLFSAGWAEGMEVSLIDAKKLDGSTIKGGKVRVTPGLALDDLGRAIINVRDVELIPQARYLCVRYAERKDRPQEGSCTPKGVDRGEIARWAGPERIVSEAEFTWRTAPPQQDLRELVIAVLELNADCSVKRVVSGPAHIAAATQVSKVFSYALEGEKNIDSRNSKILRFHINGRTPNAVSLCLRARPFSSLYYTEMGSHTHAAQASNSTANGSATSISGTLKTDPASSLDDHKHAPGDDQKSADHSHTVLAPVHARTTVTDNKDGDGNVVSRSVDFKKQVFELVEATDTILETVKNVFIPGQILISIGQALFDFFSNRTQFYGQVDLNSGFGKDSGGQDLFSVSGGSAAISGNTGNLIADSVPTPAARHKHEISVVVANDPFPIPGGFPVRNGAQLSDFVGLRVSIDRSNPEATTAAILEQAARNRPDAWHGVGSLYGGAASPLSTKEGTGLIRLDLLSVNGVAFDPGVHEIEFSVEGANNGGCLQYSLYVE